MQLPSLLYDLLFDHTLRTVALGAAVLGAVSGALGAFAVLRRQSLLGDAVSHSALPGIALAFLLTGSKAPLVLVLGAALAGWLGTLLVTGIIRATRIKDDSALGLVLSVFFGFGLVLLTYIQKHVPTAAQAGLDRFLFGQAATLLKQDVWTMTVVGAAVLVVLVSLWKEFKLLSFDRDFMASLGFRVRLLDVLLTSLLVLAIVIGLQTVGVVLMSALVVAPAAAARQWTDRLSVMTILSAGFGALAGVTGVALSSTTARLPPGPTVVLCVTALVLLSLLTAPNRGLLAQWLRDWQNRRRLQLQAVLANLQALAAQHPSLDHPHAVSVLRAMSTGPSNVERSLEELAARGWARQMRSNLWVITPDGLQEATRLEAENKPQPS